MVAAGRRPAPALDLEAGSLDPSALSMGALMREIELSRRPPALLRTMMAVLERQRQSRRLGWSRPWNKTGMNIFRTHIHDSAADAGYLGLWRAAIDPLVAGLPPSYLGFLEGLWTDPARMAFTFYHNRVEGGESYEGFTLSLGRKVPEDKSKRDRVDILVEDQRIHGRVDNRPDRLRIILNPYSEWARDLKPEADLRGDAISAGAVAAYSAGAEFYRRHREDPARQWDHWSSRYIGYFGPRSFIPHGSAFT